MMKRAAWGLSAPVFGAVSAAVMVTAGVGALTVALQHYQDWGKPLESYFSGLAEDLYDVRGLPTLTVVSAIGRTQGYEVVSLVLTVEPRESATIPVNATVVTLRTPTATASTDLNGTANRSGVVRALRDVDGSAALGLLNRGDLVEIEIPLAALGLVLGPRQRATLTFLAPDDAPVLADLETPSTLHTPIVPIEVDQPR